MNTPSVEPRPAATLVVLRDAPRGPEVLITIRPRSLRFMGGAAVFPGGAVAQADRDPAWAALSPVSPDDAALVLQDDDPSSALGSFVAAIREAFEEVGLFLAAGPTDRVSRDDLDAQAFLAACASLRLRLRTDDLRPAGRWVTPLGSPVRFDTRFFVARAPEGWEPVANPSEVEECFWMSAGEALERVADGRLMMAPPTIEMLQRIAPHGSVAEVFHGLEEAPLTGAGNVLSVRLSPLVHVVLAPNPGVMTGPGTNTYIVGTGPRYVIDPAVDEGEFLDEVVRVAGGVAGILITHRHSDHVGGCAALARRTRATVHAFGDAPAGEAGVVRVTDGETFDSCGVQLTALHTPGHASDHLSFYMQGGASLFAGDNILGEGTAVIAPPDGNLRDYLASLQRLRALHIDRIYPGHFRPLDGGTAVIEGYLAHREQRRVQVLDVLRSGARTPEAVVEVVYADVDPQLHPVAALQVTALLEMLRDEDVVEQREGRWNLKDVD